MMWCVCVVCVFVFLSVFMFENGQIGVDLSGVFMTNMRLDVDLSGTLFSFGACVLI